MKTPRSNYLLLVLTIAISFLSICTFDFYPDEPYDKSLDAFRFLTPGVSFSLYIVFLQRHNWNFGRLVLFFLILMVLYFASLFCGLHSWGFAVPFVGAIGSALIKKIFYQRDEFLSPQGKKYLLYGFAAGLLGFVLHLLFSGLTTFGLGFGLILITWQFIFGTLWIKQIDLVSLKKN